MSNEKEQDVYDKIEMTEEQARDILAHIVAQRIRWGKQYDGSEFGYMRLIDALVVLAYAENNETAELRASLATANRQEGAGRAREGKLKKKVENLENEITALNAVIDRLSNAAESSEDGERED